MLVRAEVVILVHDEASIWGRSALLFPAREALTGPLWQSEEP